MRALVLRHVGAAGDPAPLELTDAAEPSLGPGEVLIGVSVCGLCRTDLDLVEGRIVAPRYPLIPGHQIVGRVAAINQASSDVRVGDRVGVAWIHSACGECRWCLGGQENLCPRFRSTGCDANGGYAELVTAPAAFIHRIPEALSDAEAAPLLRAGAIGWRSLRLTGLRDGETLGLVGFGASAHLVLQLARHTHPASRIFVFARDQKERQFARALGAVWSGDVGEAPPTPMHAAIDTTPAWKPVVDTLAHVAPGGRLVINAIRKSPADRAELMRLDYETHLWMEREIKSVANVTRADVRDVLRIAAETGLRPTVSEVPLARTNDVLSERRAGASVRGATVVRVARQ